jgi:folate-binding protein YgfZ
MENKYIPLEDRSVISISGNDAEQMLQGVITNDIKKTSHNYAIYSLLLTPQGKYLFDFFILKNHETSGYLIDISTSQKEGFLKKLKMYKLRSKAEIQDVSSDLSIAALIGEKVFDKIEKPEPGKIERFCEGSAYIDPRSKKMYARAYIKKENNYKAFEAQEFSPGGVEEYHKLRVENKVAEGAYDMSQEKSFPMHFAMKDLNAIDFEKGCYVGQEVTARMNYRGNIKKTVYKIKSPGNLQKGQEIFDDKKNKIGETLTCLNKEGLAQLNVKEVKKSSIVQLDDGTALQIED